MSVFRSQQRMPVCAIERNREERVQARATAEASRTEVERQLAETRVEIERLDGDLKLAAERLENAAQRRTRATEEKQDAQKRAAQGERETEALVEPAAEPELDHEHRDVEPAAELRVEGEQPLLAVGAGGGGIRHPGELEVEDGAEHAAA